MGISSVPVGWEDVQEDFGCAYIIGEYENRQICGAPQKPASPYCPEHHRLCHVDYGSQAEADRLREVEAIAKVVGGRRSRYGIKPSGRFLRRIERAVRGFSRSNCS